MSRSGASGRDAFDFMASAGRRITTARHGFRASVATAQARPTLHDLSAALTAIYGTDFGVHSPTSISRFTDAARQAASYRVGRVLLAGDAAARSAGGRAGPSDRSAGCGEFRLEAGAGGEGRVAADVVIRPSGTRSRRWCCATRWRRWRCCVWTMFGGALRDCVADLLKSTKPASAFRAMMSGLDFRYDFGHGHPLLGRRRPISNSRPQMVRNASSRCCTRRWPLLLDFGQAGDLDITPYADAWSDRVQRVDARYVGAWQLPVIGELTAPQVVLIRPDGHVAWVGEGTSKIYDALARWFG